MKSKNFGYLHLLDCYSDWLLVKNHKKAYQPGKTDNKQTEQVEQNNWKVRWKTALKHLCNMFKLIRCQKE